MVEWDNGAPMLVFITTAVRLAMGLSLVRNMAAMGNVWRKENEGTRKAWQFVWSNSDCELRHTRVQQLFRGGCRCCAIKSHLPPMTSFLPRLCQVNEAKEIGKLLSEAGHWSFFLLFSVTCARQIAKYGMGLKVLYL